MANPNPVKGEVEFPFRGKTWRFTFPWEAIAAYESATGKSVANFLLSLKMVEVTGELPLLSLTGEFMRCGLMTHHPEVTAEQGCEMFFDALVQEKVNEAMTAAMPSDEQAASAGEQPPASSRSGGSKASSASGSKRAAKKTPSGKRRPG